MDEESQRSDGLSNSLNLLTLAACIAGVAAGGAVAVAAAVVGVACLLGSLALDAAPKESPCERYGRECRESPGIDAAEPAIGQAPEVSQQWRQVVASSRGAGRHR